MVAGAITNGHVKINKIKPETIKIISSKLIEMGAIVNSGDDWVEVDATKTELISKDISTRTISWLSYRYASSIYGIKFNIKWIFDYRRNCF